MDQATVVIESNFIRRVAPGTIDFPADARIIDARGKTILPGLIDNMCIIALTAESSFLLMALPLSATSATH